MWTPTPQRIKLMLILIKIWANFQRFPGCPSWSHLLIQNHKSNLKYYAYPKICSFYVPVENIFKLTIIQQIIQKYTHNLDHSSSQKVGKPKSIYKTSKRKQSSRHTVRKEKYAVSVYCNSSYTVIQLYEKGLYIHISCS